jgi:hypothetical protein
VAASRNRAALGALLAILAALGPALARADQPASDRAGPASRPSADDLFQEGRRLMEAGRLAAACQRFAESERLEPAGGTLLNLAVCHELEGKLPLAWTEFGEALVRARRDVQPERAQLAREHLASLERRLAFLVVTFEPGAGGTEVALTLDGAPFAPAHLGQPWPRLPGPARIEARAPGATAWTKPLTLLAGQRVSVAVPRLERVVVAAPTLPARPRWGPRRVGAAVTTGVAAAALAVGAGYGIRAISRSSAANARCTAASPCNDPTALRWNHEARTAALVADVTLAVGLVSAGIATWLWLTSRERPVETRRPARALALAPVWAPGGGGLALGGAW